MAIASLAVALAALADLTPRLSSLPFALLVASPTLCLYCVNIYLHDLFVLALTAMFFWALAARRLTLSLVLLFLLQAARESTVVIAVAVLVVAFFRRQWGWMSRACVAWVGGVLLVAAVSREALSNIHAMNGGVYLLSKVVANGAENLLGITVWSDTYARQLPHYYPSPPIWKMDVPAWLPLGGMKSVGVFRYSGWRPFDVLVILLSAFGVLPVVLMRQCRKALLGKEGGAAQTVGDATPASRWRERLSDVCRVWQAQAPVVQVALLVGTAFLLLSPFAGRTVERQVGYGWPLFWIALLELQKPRGSGSEPVGFGFLERPGFWALQSVCMWWPTLTQRVGLLREGGCLLGAVGVVACLFAATRCTHKRTMA